MLDALFNVTDTEHAHTRKTVLFTEFLPPEWFASGGSVWTECFRILRAPIDLLPPDPFMLDVGDVRALVMYGTPSYLDTRSVRVELNSAHEWHIDGKEVKETSAPEGRYVILMTPLPDQAAEPRARAAVATAVGLLTAINGRNMAWEQVYGNIIQSNGRSGFSPTWESPLAFPVPDLGESGRQRLDGCAAAYSQLPPVAQARLSLSLRWLESAVRDKDADAVVKYWIALETLVMPDDTNVRPIIESLKRSYGKPLGEVKSIFGVGRLFGLRSRIVHRGALVPIHQELLRYMEGLFVDVLLDFLGRPSEGRALSVLKQPGFDLKAYLHE